MKQPDETLDFWVRQALEQLPDTPPADTTFEPDRLWQQLRPALQKPAETRRLGWVWWASAACTVVLLGLWALLREGPANQGQAVRSTRHTETPATRPDTQLTARVDGAKLAMPVNADLPALRRSHSSKTVPNVFAPVLPAQEREELVADALDVKSVADTSAAVLVVLERVAKPAIATAAKRHFQVVHQNELETEAQIQPNPQRTDRFVRMGAGRRDHPAVEDTHPTITWSLANK